MTFGTGGFVQTDNSAGGDDLARALLEQPDGSIVLAAYTVAGGSGGDVTVARYVPGGPAVQRVYALQDANYNVTALVDTSGSVVERFEYDPYGRSSVLTSGWGSTTDTYDWSVRFQGGKQEAATGHTRSATRTTTLPRDNGGRRIPWDSSMEPTGTDTFDSHRTAVWTRLGIKPPTRGRPRARPAPPPPGQHASAPRQCGATTAASARKSR